MKRTIILASILVLCLLQTGWGQVPRTISYQGVLKDDAGNLINDSVNLAFSLWDVETGGTALWSSETYLDFEVTAGIFHVNLGSSKPFDLDFDAQYWLQITVNGGPLSPRVQLTSSPYSFSASAVLGAIAAMPVQSWNYKTQDPSIRHLGPMAQDFYEAFGLGEDEKYINTVDIDGINVLAIQALEKRTRELEDTLQRLDEQAREIEALQAAVAALRLSSGQALEDLVKVAVRE